VALTVAANSEKVYDNDIRQATDEERARIVAAADALVADATERARPNPGAGRES
jgi:hypothetical protein